MYSSFLYGLHPSTSQIHSLIAPSLFLVMAQILCETIAFVSAPFFTVYIRFVVTTAFVSYRLSVLLQWYDDTPKWAASQEAAGLPPSLIALVRATALINVVFWAFALLCFLLLYCSPELIIDSGGVGGDGDEEYYYYFVDETDVDNSSGKVEQQQQQQQQEQEQQEQQQEQQQQRVVDDYQCNGSIVTEKVVADTIISESSPTSSRRLQRQQQVQGDVKVKST